MNDKGMTPAELAAFDRFLASMREFAVARHRLSIQAHETSGALSNFMAAWQANEDRLTAEEARQVADHPDLAEVNVRLDALYDPPTQRAE